MTEPMTNSELRQALSDARETGEFPKLLRRAARRIARQPGGAGTGAKCEDVGEMLRLLAGNPFDPDAKLILDTLLAEQEQGGEDDDSQDR